MAIVLPLLLLLLFGVIDFGRALNAQITLTQAAREGARVAAFGATQAQVQTHVTLAATGLTGAAATLNYQCQYNDGPAGKDTSVTVNYTFNFITPVGAIAALFNNGNGGNMGSLNLSANGVMPCET